MQEHTDGLSDELRPPAAPPAIVDLIDAPLTPAVSVSPDRRWLLILDRRALPSIEELAQPELRLAGLRINPRNSSRSRGSHFISMTLRDSRGQADHPVVGLPEDARLRYVGWSPDSRHVSLVVMEEDACRLWIADIDTAIARPLGSGILSCTAGSPYFWTSDSQSLVVRYVPADRPPAPTMPLKVDPVVHENINRTAAARTFQDLLQTPHDESLLEYYLTSQLVRVALSGEATPLSGPDMYIKSDPSPGGAHLLIETIRRPFSYRVPASRFPMRAELWDSYGNPLRSLAQLPLAEEVPSKFEAVRPGRRWMTWRGDVPETLVWVQAADGGDPQREAEVRDRLYACEAPCEEEPTLWMELGLRFRGVNWGEDGLVLVQERWWPSRRERVWKANFTTPDQPPELMFDRSTEDRYQDPGRPLTRPTESGHRVLMRTPDGQGVYLVGEGASESGNRPFLDRMDLATHQTQRLWQCQHPHYEWPVTFLDAAKQLLLTQREGVTEPPNCYFHSLAAKHAGDQATQLTEFPHPTPQLRHAQKELIRYQRPDGITCTATLYLPEDYTPQQGPLPLLMWVYPEDYKSADAASQLTDSPNRFIRVGSYTPLHWLTQGYAILNGPTMPIIGEEDHDPNDTYVEQLTASAQAVVEEVVRRGVARRGHIAIGGHSYGAFTVANLLAHSELFCAGVAASGAYNRTLTPFGFQAEERTLWQAPEVYWKMSPLMAADKIRAPLLLLHGQADENAGTFPLQSERFFQALAGQGATTRLVLLPHEGHVYQARESLLRVAAEINAWLEAYVPRPEG